LIHLSQSAFSCTERFNKSVRLSRYLGQNELPELVLYNHGDRYSHVEWLVIRKLAGIYEPDVSFAEGHWTD
jgi:hypothetical protein